MCVALMGSLVQAAQHKVGRCCSPCLLCLPDQPCSVGRQASCPVSLHGFEHEESAPAVSLCYLQRIKAALEQASMAITNPLRAAVSNLMFWVPKNDVRNEKIIQEVGLEQDRPSVDHCCVFSRPPGALHGRCAAEGTGTSFDAVQWACSAQRPARGLYRSAAGLAGLMSVA